MHIFANNFEEKTQEIFIEGIKRKFRMESVWAVGQSGKKAFSIEWHWVQKKSTAFKLRTAMRVEEKPNRSDLRISTIKVQRSLWTISCEKNSDFFLEKITKTQKHDRKRKY